MYRVVTIQKFFVLLALLDFTTGDLVVVHSSHHGEASQTTLLDLCWRSGQVLSVQDVRRVLQDGTEIRYQYLNGSLRLSVALQDSK